MYRRRKEGERVPGTTMRRQGGVGVLKFTNISCHGESARSYTHTRSLLIHEEDTMVVSTS